MNKILFNPLLFWYDHHQRTLPWRALPSEQPNPYYVWLSEVMLQQTTVITVIPYFQRFIRKWPTVFDLAQATLDDIFHQWQGLGYYSRARNLHKCAQKIVQDYEGIFPRAESDLLKLPGIGPYTAAAISSIAFEEPTIPVDGNVIRVFSRFFAEETPLPKLKNIIFEKAKDLVPFARRGDFAQALMDLGATICKPAKPLCEKCPLSKNCLGRERGMESKLPLPAPKVVKPTRYGIVFWIENGAGQVFIRKREEKGLLHGLMEFPSTHWVDAETCLEESISFCPFPLDEWQVLDQKVKHTFTHFHLILRIIKGKRQGGKGLWVSPADFKDYALPTLMKKVTKVILTLG
jgi:A/G-specific adenine glycosylase